MQSQRCLSALAFLAGVLLAVAGCSPVAKQLQSSTPAVSRIAFGSCLRQSEPVPILTAVVATDPQLFVFLGDNIYGDSEDMTVLQKKYDALRAKPEFQALAKVPMLATWDDHDYGMNDAGREYSQRVASQQLFLDFFGVPADDVRRQREGVYHSEIVGPPGRRLQVLLLDTRYHRTALNALPKRPPGRGPYLPNVDTTGSMLGAKQWKWLEQELRKPAELRILASSVQLLADEHGWECWGNMPWERAALLRLLQGKNVIVLSGDRHHAEVSLDGKAGQLGEGLYDITASSLNQGRSSVNESNRYRVGEPYPGTNFGFLEIDWDRKQVQMEIRDEHGVAKITANASF
ncbi:MAG: alkaline phosphatase D family protein [Planctomycetota bacterium]